MENCTQKYGLCMYASRKNVSVDKCILRSKMRISIGSWNGGKNKEGNTIII